MDFTDMSKDDIMNAIFNEGKNNQNNDDHSNEDNYEKNDYDSELLDAIDEDYNEFYDNDEEDKDEDDYNEDDDSELDDELEIDINEDNEDEDLLDRNSSYTNRNNNSSNSEENDVEFLRVTFKSNNKVIQFFKMPPTSGEDDRYDRLDAMDESYVDMINSKITGVTEGLRGTGIVQIFENIGCPIKIDTSWEEEIIRFIDDMTSNVNSNRTYASWSKPNLYTRHIALLPGRVPMKLSIPNIYIMFDQSGSMSNNEIRKINYIIQYFFDKKYNIVLMIHDYATNIQDVKLYEFNKSKRNNDNLLLNELINSRVMAGGTSHLGAFKLMEEYIDQVTNSDKKYNTNYCIICSDLESDIEEIYKSFKWPDLIGNNTFALTTGNYKLPFGKTINILSQDNL